MFLPIASFALVCAVSYGTFYMVRWHVRRRRLYKLVSKFEGPPVLPIIGNAHMFIGNNESLLIRVDELIRSYSSPCRVWFGPILAFLITDPEQIKTICLSPKALEKGEMYTNFTRPLLGSGLLTAPVSEWRVHRKLIQPTFNTKILDTFVEALATQSKIFIGQLEQNLGEPEIEIFKLVSFCTLDMICETAMGVELGAQSKGNAYYVKALQETLASIVKRFYLFWLQSDFIFYRTKLGRDQQKHNKYLRNFVDNVIQMKKKEHLKRQSQPSKTFNEDDACNLTPRRETFADLLMKLTYDNASLSDDALSDEVITMVLAGSDTSAVTISFAMLMLASHPDVQEKVYQELYEIYGDSDIEESSVTPKDLPKMKYLERVIKETLRLFPVGPFIIRKISEDLDIGDRILPTGSEIVVAILSLHRNEKYWPDPLKFDPDRFLPEENAKRHPFAFMAFSGGPRNCIGLNYAMMSIKTLLAIVLRKYVLKKDNIVPIKDIRLRFEFVITTADPITLRIEKRNTK